jgi:murein DD-endopeptidase MepM/ murein hydrolase activator NlpD
VPVSSVKPVRLSPPLHGDQWIAEAAFSPTSYHRRAILPIEGNFYLAQRYAIDWERMCNDGLEVHQNMHENANWQAYGYEVLASADGVISKIATNSIPDNIPPGLPNPPPPLSDVSGNYVILDTIQNNKHYYILYAHMQPGSIKVKLGQKITRGQVLGLVGNSGNSAAPHLHMHVTETNEAEKSNGVPFVFETATIQGNAEEVDEDYGIWVKPQSLIPQTFKGIIPTENQLFYFDTLNRHCP